MSAPVPSAHLHESYRPAGSGIIVEESGYIARSADYVLACTDEAARRREALKGKKPRHLVVCTHLHALAARQTGLKQHVQHHKPFPGTC